MVEKEVLQALKEKFRSFLNGYSERTIKSYLYWYTKFPHEAFLKSLDNGKPQEIIDLFIEEWPNSVTRAFLRNYLKLLELSKEYDIPEIKRTTKNYVRDYYIFNLKIKDYPKYPLYPNNSNSIPIRNLTSKKVDKVDKMDNSQKVIESFVCKDQEMLIIQNIYKECVCVFLHGKKM